MNRWLIVAALLGTLGVVLGAFGAHGLRARLEPQQLASWQTAVQYHLLHTLALAGLALHAAQSGRAIGLQAWLFTAGIVLFSGSIYLLVLGGPRWLGPVTPLGGLCMIGGWLSLLLLARS